MNKLRNVLNRYRLVTSVLALVFLLAALAVTPGGLFRQRLRQRETNAGRIKWLRLRKPPLWSLGST